MFHPEILFGQIEFTLISLLGTLIVFMIVEGIRYNRLSYIGEFLHKTLSVFQDTKDLQGPLNLSYIYLLAGVTIPIVYDYLVNKDTVTIIRYSGLITLGVGDTFASVIGKSLVRSNGRAATNQYKEQLLLLSVFSFVLMVLITI